MLPIFPYIFVVNKWMGCIHAAMEEQVQ